MYFLRFNFNVMNNQSELVLSKSKKLALIEGLVIFFYIVFVLNTTYGIFYLLYSPAIPLLFTIGFLITGFLFERKFNFWRGLAVLNTVIFIFLSSVFWFGDIFKNFR